MKGSKGVLQCDMCAGQHQHELLNASCTAVTMPSRRPCRNSEIVGRCSAGRNTVPASSRTMPQNPAMAGE